MTNQITKILKPKKGEEVFEAPEKQTKEKYNKSGGIIENLEGKDVKWR